MIKMKVKKAIRQINKQQAKQSAARLDVKLEMTIAQFERYKKDLDNFYNK